MSTHFLYIHHTIPSLRFLVDAQSPDRFVLLNRKTKKKRKVSESVSTEVSERVLHLVTPSRLQRLFKLQSLSLSSLRIAGQTLLPHYLSDTPPIDISDEVVML